MTSGLVNASFSLPKWQAVKMIFFAPWKGRDFTRRSIKIDAGNLSFPFVKRLRGLTEDNGCGIVKIISWFCYFFHSLKIAHLQLFNLKQRSKVDMWKGYHLSMNVIQKVYLFYQKWYIQGSEIGSWGGASPSKTLLSIPHQDNRNHRKFTDPPL